MGREIRLVPADWEHPRKDCKHSPWAGGCSDALLNNGRCLQPLYDQSYERAAAEWKAGFMKWERGEDPDRAEHPECEFWEWNGMPPEPESYRPDWPEGAATHYQVYETVSEGTPVTPHFATKAELIDYLVAHGDRWDQSRGHGGWSRLVAEQFVEREWAPSLMVLASPSGSVVHEPRDGDLPAH